MASGVLIATASGLDLSLSIVVLAAFPAVIAYGKHLHLMLAPVNVVLKHMTEVPSDRPVFGNDLDMDLEDEAKLEKELARLGMEEGVGAFTFGPLFDQAACIQCGRCVQACNEVQVNNAIDFGYKSGATKIVAKDDNPLKDSDCVFCGECIQACPVDAIRVDAATGAKVIVESRRAGLAAAEGVRWESDGEGEFTIEEIEREERGVPVLLRQYLRLKATLLGFNVDPAFHNCLDGLMLVGILVLRRLSRDERRRLRLSS